MLPSQYRYILCSRARAGVVSDSASIKQLLQFQEAAFFVQTFLSVEIPFYVDMVLGK